MCILLYINTCIYTHTISLTYLIQPYTAHTYTSMTHVRSLRTVKDWSDDRDVFNIEACKIQKEFRDNMHVAAGS